MGSFVDLSGIRFGRLLVLARSGTAADGCVKWSCVCDCGNTKVIKSASLVHAGTQSCGCLQREAAQRQSLRHGHLVNDRQSPEYTTWRAMLRRCKDKALVNFSNYGGRGIKVCERWHVFENFVADVGRRPDGTSLDRIDSSGNYEPGNVRWSTQKQQCRNTRTNRLLTNKGKTMCVAEWAEQIGISENTIRGRLFRGASDEVALTVGRLKR